MAGSATLRQIKLNLQILLRLPWWFFKSIIPALRARPTWSLKRATTMEVARYFTRNLFSTGWSDGGTHKELKLGNGVMGTYIDPIPQFVKGDLAKWAANADVQSIQIPGYWLHRRGTNLAMGEKPSPGNEKIFYFLHGGAYVSLSAHPSSVISTIPKQLMKRCPTITRTFSIEYRLCVADGALTKETEASNPGPFPAALLDALAGYVYLVHKVGFSPSDIIFLGDSAGGNLALALTRYLVENQNDIADLPTPPGGLVLLSPWCDLSDSHVFPGSSYEKNANADFVELRPNAVRHSIAAKLFIHEKQLHEVPDFFLTNPYVSPASLKLDASFKGWPRMFLNGGGAEVLIDQIRVLKQRMQRDMGEENVEFLEAPDAVHDYLSHELCEPERTQLINAVSNWVSRFFASPQAVPKVKASL
ncbi:alpha/beta-hydrolase [Schizopora paradoxa]|uniref:Alpha/beta-hydrolase n=1 Tax=Schizopora paradoxa TaxID=27342 RepID=A0A0H2RGQ9_9AGAM|nr:alpha/beta-hydrolase [Schizopora paradoxa]